MEGDLDKLESVFGKVSQAESTFEVFASAKHYPNLTKVFVPGVGSNMRAFALLGMNIYCMLLLEGCIKN